MPRLFPELSDEELGTLEEMGIVGQVMAGMQNGESLPSALAAASSGGTDPRDDPPRPLS